MLTDHLHVVLVELLTGIADAPMPPALLTVCVVNTGWCGVGGVTQPEGGLRDVCFTAAGKTLRVSMSEA